MLTFLRSLAFSAGMLVTVIAYGALVPLIALLPFARRYAFTRHWARLNLRWLELTCGVRYRLVGQENLPQRPVVVLSKHQSTWETLVFQEIFPPLVWVMKRELLWLPLFGWGLALGRPIAIDRGAGRRAMEQMLSQGQQRLDDGLWVVIFPEGTRMPPGRHIGLPCAIGRSICFVGDLRKKGPVIYRGGGIIDTVLRLVAFSHKVVIPFLHTETSANGKGGVKGYVHFTQTCLKCRRLKGQCPKQQ